MHLHHSTPWRPAVCQKRATSNRANRPIAGHPLRLLLAGVLISTPLVAQSLAAGDAAFMQQRFADAQQAYRVVLAHGTLDDRKKAVLAVALIDWMIDADTARAMRDLRPYSAYSPALTVTCRA